MGQQPSTTSDYGIIRTSPSSSARRPPLLSGDREIENVPRPNFPSEGEREVPPPSVTQSLPAYTQRGGVTVVNPNPDVSWRATKPIELQKLDKVHRFWPILRSSLDSVPPQEKISDGVHYRQVLSLCLRYQEHLSETAKVVGTEQRALASRLKDIEMFSAGITQQIIRRQESLLRTNSHLQKVTEVHQALVNIQTTLESCVPLVRRLNSFLPQEKRLERFKLNTEVESDTEEEKVVLADEKSVELPDREPDS